MNQAGINPINTGLFAVPTKGDELQKGEGDGDWSFNKARN
jgi:hypothetical protein